MTAHMHSEIVPGCYRCELGQDETWSEPPCPHCNDEGVVHDMAGNVLGPCDHEDPF